MSSIPQPSNVLLHSDATSQELKAGSVNSSTIFMPGIVSSYRDEDYEQDYEPRLSFLIVGFKSDVILIFGRTLLYLWKDRYSCNLVHVLVYCNIFFLYLRWFVISWELPKVLTNDARIAPDAYATVSIELLKIDIDQMTKNNLRRNLQVFQLQLCALQYSLLGRVHADTLFSGK